MKFYPVDEHIYGQDIIVPVTYPAGNIGRPDIEAELGVVRQIARLATGGCADNLIIHQPSHFIRSPLERECVIGVTKRGVILMYLLGRVSGVQTGDDIALP